MVSLAGAVTAVSLVLGLVGPISVSAATTPVLGAAGAYSVFGKAGVTNDGSATTHVWGNVGADATNVTGLVPAQVDGVIDAGAGVGAAAGAAYGQLDAQYPGPNISLAGTVTVTPGAYNVIAPETLDGTVTLNGAGTYIFRSDSSYTVGAGAKVLLTNGATACNVFWEIPIAMHIGAGAQMVGTIITNSAEITFGDSATLQGRAIALTTQVTLIRNQITVPTCSAPSTGGSNVGTINVVKRVINDNGGTKTIADFPLFVNGTPVASGVTNNFPAPADAYAVTETSSTGYVRSFSGDCDVNGRVNLNPGDNRFCIVTNDDVTAPVVVPPVPPLIDVVKVPDPLALPSGPGPVTYTYTVRNVGTVPMTNVTLIGDTCSPLAFVSGDTNGDSKLQVNETWTYRCSTTLTQTHTNNVVATGWANGLSATDIASATVVVGVPLVPPLIHVTKVPSPLTLAAGGGMVTYTEKVTNPGTVALNNVALNDDKCPVHFVSGDTDGDSKLDTNETWTYTCQTNLTQTTTNTATATGEANGFTVRDLAIATVVVATAVPALPKTGFAPSDAAISWPVLAAVIAVASLLLYVLRKKQTA